jgi:2-C-methyl-D-erythritol 4-phosphate cytidylyltransferase
MRRRQHKAFLTWQGKSILEYTLEAFGRMHEVKAIVIMLHPDDMKKASRLMNENPKVVACLAGGTERKNSVLKGLEHIRCEFPDSITLIHDAARPFITPSLVRKLIAQVKPDQGAVPGIREPNTLKLVKNGIIRQTIDRTDLWEVQTPQCFITEEIYSCLRKAARRKITDDAQAMEMAGKKVVMVESTPFNFKITYPEDLELFKLMLGRRGR